MIEKKHIVDFRDLANRSLHNLTPYQPGKPIEALERELGISSSIKLASNENPLGPSKTVISVLSQALSQTHIYPDGAYFELKAALSSFLSVQPEQLTIGNGSENILELIVKTYLHQDDSAIIPEFAFLTIPILLQSYGVNIKIAKAKLWGADVRAMVDALDAKTRVVFLVNPNNPTGTYTTTRDFEYLLETVPKHVLIVVDEAYHEYIRTPDYPNTFDYLPQYPNLIVTRTFSKAYGLAALRLGYAISSPEIADMLNRARLPFNVNTLASKAAVAALLDQEHVARSVQLNEVGKLQMIKGLQDLSLNYIPSLGNFITLDVHDGLVIYEKMLHQGVIVRPLVAYRMPAHIRVTIGRPEENERFLSALTTVLATI